MPRTTSDWDKWFQRRERNPSYRKGTKKPGPPNPSFRAYVVGEGLYQPLSYRKSHVTKFAEERRRQPTPAERRLEEILLGLNNGVLRGKFQREHAFSGKWIADFWFPELRLAIEVDGSIHRTKRQWEKDQLKDADAARFDIIVLRISNGEVFGDRQALLERLRSGWRRALRRKNRIIGKPPAQENTAKAPVSRQAPKLRKKEYVRCEMCADKIFVKDHLSSPPSRICPTCSSKSGHSK